MTYLAYGIFLFALLFALARRKNLWLALSLGIVSLTGFYVADKPLGIKAFERALDIPFGLSAISSMLLLIVLFILIDLYMQLRAQQELITLLARKLTLMEASDSTKDKKS